MVIFIDFSILEEDPAWRGWLQSSVSDLQSKSKEPFGHIAPKRGIDRAIGHTGLEPCKGLGWRQKFGSYHCEDGNEALRLVRWSIFA